ncbi:MAG: hypothetical protein HN352_02085 [Bacteroidetes bacterium]|jgi:hypothetical protein|nr:hypothetical protein [Bacteroidota bacterium]MBT3750610.1 hypothetical protein [Bacteroidota bacterium]MBT4398236.1 hypothetical protein [Bacteroidota bacterium]MBT4409021.1 hypothetical protein [Bacteroidota bacterium]MBT5428218.1 hypothetical protein [Bacteroidota bacterium]
MRQRLSKYYLLLFALISISHTIIAQNRLSVSRGGSIAIDINQLLLNNQLGNLVADSTIWLNYTTLVREEQPDFSITIELASGSIPEGVELLVEAKPYNGISQGRHGHSTGLMPISQIPRVIIDQIGTSYTGNGIYVGHQLIFSFRVTDFGLIEPGIHSIFVQFTLSQ